MKIEIGAPAEASMVPEKCTRQLVLTVAMNAKYLLSPQKTVRYTVVTAFPSTGSPGKTDFKEC